MKLMMFPATPPYTGYFGDVITTEMATKYESEQEAHDEVAWLISDQMEKPEKYEGYKVIKL